MKRARIFDIEKISDQKRLARGEQWLCVRSLMRAWHRTHQSNWEVLTLAGMAPAGEFSVIRELMPRARIVAADKDEACISAARDAGADEVVLVDLADWTYDDDCKSPRAARALRDRSFDVINLDLCSGASEQTMMLARVYSSTNYLRRPGVLMVTFSYGRDVVEFFQHSTYGSHELEEAGVPNAINARIGYVLGHNVFKVLSVITYIGNEMPMCSVVVGFKGAGNAGRLHAERVVSFVKLQDGDFELAVTHPDVSRLYDCPRERIEFFRRQQAAQKAVATRRGLSARVIRPQERQLALLSGPKT